MAASTGNSSISCAVSAPSIAVVPSPSLGAEIRKVPTNSEHRSSRCSTETFAPRAARTSSSAERVGLSPIESSTRLEPGNSAAAHKKNAADDKSPGTAASMAVSLCGPTIVTESCARDTEAPNARRAISLWSRVRTASRTIVVPAVCRPASNTHVFTCALGTGVV